MTYIRFVEQVVHQGVIEDVMGLENLGFVSHRSGKRNKAIVHKESKSSFGSSDSSYYQICDVESHYVPPSSIQYATTLQAAGF